eukprot:4157385-Amphidinium_carterae.1
MKLPEGDGGLHSEPLSLSQDAHLEPSFLEVKVCQLLEQGLSDLKNLLGHHTQDFNGDTIELIQT